MRKFLLITTLFFIQDAIGQPLNALLAKKAGVPFVSNAFDPAKSGPLVSLTNGNLTFQITPTPGNNSSLSVLGVNNPSGKYRFEFTIDNTSSVTVGVANISANLSDGIGNNANGWALFINGSGAQLFHNGTGGSISGTTFANGHVVTGELDIAAATLTFYYDNVAMTGGVMTSVSASTLYIGVGAYGTTGKVTLNNGPTLTYPRAGYQSGLY